MSDQRSNFPRGLTRRLFDRLAESAESASGSSPAHLLQAADNHLERVREANQRNPFINYRLAEALWEVMRTVVYDWNQIADIARPWLLGAMHYFAGDNDEEPDFTSPIGFEDDAEVLNACLRFAGREDLCLNTEDYDDV